MKNKEFLKLPVANEIIVIVNTGGERSGANSFSRR